MLVELHIRDFAIIEDLQLDLAPGFTVFTGETGAGQSLHRYWVHQPDQRADREPGAAARTGGVAGGCTRPVRTPQPAACAGALATPGSLCAVGEPATGIRPLLP